MRRRVRWRQRKKAAMRTRARTPMAMPALAPWLRALEELLEEEGRRVVVGEGVEVGVAMMEEMMVLMIVEVAAGEGTAERGSSCCCPGGGGGGGGSLVLAFGGGGTGRHRTSGSSCSRN